MEEEREICQCDNCGCDIDRNNDTNYVTNNGSIICEDCLNSDYFICHDCDEIHSNDDMNYITGADYYVCNYCRDNYSYCDGCDNYFDDNREHMHSVEGQYLCESCYEEYCEENDVDIVNSYHNRDLPINFLSTDKDKEDKTIFPNAEKFETGSSEDMLKFGMEIEVENDCYRISCNEMAHMIRNKFPHLELVFEEDGSLSNGMEIITQPMTMSYIREHKEDFRELCKMLDDNGFTSHNNGRCGQHIHFSRCFFEDDDDKYVGKLQLFFEKYKDEIYKFSRRTDKQWCRWVSDSSNYKKEYLRSGKILCDYAKSNTGHGVAINLQHSSTIEIRVFRGTLRFETMMANFEFVNNLVHIIKEKPTRQINFDKITNYVGTEYLKQYCLDRNIFNSEFMSDETTNIINILQNQKDKYETVKKDVKTNIQSILNELLELSKELISTLPELTIENENTIQNILETTSNLQYTISNNLRCLKSDIFEEDNEKVENNLSKYLSNSSLNFRNIISRYSDIKDCLPINDYTRTIRDKMNNIINTFISKYGNNGEGVEI